MRVRESIAGLLRRAARGVRRVGRARLVAGAAVAAVGVVSLGVWVRCGPLPPDLLDGPSTASTVVTDRLGAVLFEARNAYGTRGEWIASDQIPEVVAQATLAAEDHRFRSHIGIDPVAILRAAWSNVRAGRIVEGGSTITQQVAELLRSRQHDGRRRRGWRAKIDEAVLALRIEHRLNKDEILGLYLNLAPYGNQIEGVQRAAQAYLGGPLDAGRAVTPAEAAFLAALPQQPSRFNPWKSPDAARARQQRILTSMALNGWLSADGYQLAMREHVVLRRDRHDQIAPHFVERVLATAPPDARRVETTLDARLQRAVQGIIAAHRAELDAHHASNVAVVVLDNRRAEWLAWEGSGGYFARADGGAIDGVVSPRQPGSALKPFTYAAAFERDRHPGTVLADVPSQFPTAEPGVLYSPQNYDGRFRGPLLARLALAGSENVPAVALASEIGVPAVARLLRRVGLTTIDQNAAHYGLGLTLGNAEVRLDELVSAYGVFARGGVHLAPRSVLHIDGVEAPAPAARIPERVLSERTAFWITDILSDADARAYVFGRGGSLEFPFAVAAKTGTSQAYHDNWAIGYTRDVTVGVWVGNFDRTPLRGSSGITGAGPIFHDVMLAAVEHARGSLPIDDVSPIAPATADVRRATLCAVSGLTATSHCVRRVSEWVPTERKVDSCTWHQDSEDGLITVWPTVYEYWARGEGLWRHAGRIAERASTRPSFAEAVAVGSAPKTPPPATSANATGVRALSIVAPVSGATYSIDSTLRAEFQTLPLRATGGDATSVLDWFVNGTPVGSVAAGGTIRWAMTRGTHAITVRDRSGRSAETRVEVR